MRIVLTFIIGQTAQFGIGGKSLEATVDKHVAMIFFRIADPHESSIAGNGTMIEEGWTSPQDGIAPSVNATVQPVAAAIGL